jgi:hypothetical protein
MPAGYRRSLPELAGCRMLVSWDARECAPSPQGRPSPDLYNSARHGVRKAAHRQALNRLRGPNVAKRTETVVPRAPSTGRTGRTPSREHGPSTSGQPGTSDAGMPRTDTTKLRDHPAWLRAPHRAPLSAGSAIVSACGASSTPRAKASKPPGPTASPVQGSGPRTRTRTGRCRGDPTRSHAGPHQRHSASLRRIEAGPAGRKHPATAASW